jgi:hypothetical protein
MRDSPDGLNNRVDGDCLKLGNEKNERRSDCGLFKRFAPAESPRALPPFSTFQREKILIAFTVF